MSDNGKQPAPALQLIEIEAGEVGDLVHIETPGGCFTATWLGEVLDGKSLARAMQLMADIAQERETEQVG